MTLSEKTRCVLLVVVVTAAIIWVKKSNAALEVPPEIQVDGMEMIYAAYIFKLNDQCWFYLKSDEKNQLIQVECPKGKGLWN